MVEIHTSARKHGIADEDIKHAVTHAMTIVGRDDDELAIHAMRMRLKYQRLLRKS